MDDKPYLDCEAFSCAGGMSEGFRRAGINFDIVIELEEDHCASYEANFGFRPIRIDAHDFLKLIRAGSWKPRKPIRLFVFDPPCTPWSRAGKREGEMDPRDCLKLTCDIIRELQPMMYLIGNVPGLDDGPNLHIVQRTIGALSEVGYCTADFARLDAVNYGVPQHRIRPFWFGHKRGPCILWPAPTHGDPDDLRDQETLPGITPLIPWISCRQALQHLPEDERGRKTKLRHRNATVHDTSQGNRGRDLDDPSSSIVGGETKNAKLLDNAPRANERGGKKYGPAQGYRVQDQAKPASSVTRALHHTKLGLFDDRGHLVPLVPRMRPRDVSQANRVRDADRPSAMTTKAARKGVGESSTIVYNNRHAPADSESPAPTMGAKYRGQSAQVMVVNDKHRPIEPDGPSGTVRGGGRGHSAPAVVLKTAPNHPASHADQPANTIRAGDGGGAIRAIEWPWDRPATTVQRDERLAPPGHHDEWSIMSMPDAIVISEKAAAIIQGFPDSWVFVGETKKARWNQIGQAMPAPLAHAVATSVVRQWDRTIALEIPDFDTCEHGIVKNGSCHRCFAVVVDQLRDQAADEFADHVCSSKATEPCHGCRELGADVPDLVTTFSQGIEV